jgi:hypothetical protein
MERALAHGASATAELGDLGAYAPALRLGEAQRRKTNQVADYALGQFRRLAALSQNPTPGHRNYRLASGLV